MRRHRNERLEAYFREQTDLGIAAVWLFESRPPRRPPWESRLGLAVLVDPHRHPTLRNRSALRAHLETDLPDVAEAPIADLVLLDDAPSRLGRRIVSEGRRLLLRQPEIERAYLRDVQLRAADVDVFLRRARRLRPPVSMGPPRIARPARVAR